MIDEFAEVQAALKGPGTAGWWERVLPELDPERLDALMRNAADRTISHRTISVVLDRWGYPVTVAQVAHWRRTHVG